MSNPFNSSQIQPGARPFIFLGDETPEGLLKRTLGCGRCYLIVGAHGTGKSTLLKTLYDCWQLQTRDAESNLSGKVQANSRMLWLRPTGKPNNTLLKSLPSWRTGDLVFLDGLEQLLSPIRSLVQWYIKLLRANCIATSHQLHPGFHLLWRTEMNAELEQRVVASFLENANDASVSRLLESEAWLRSRQKNQSNLRESLFDMYDWWQAESSRTRG